LEILGNHVVVHIGDEFGWFEDIGDDISAHGIGGETLASGEAGVGEDVAVTKAGNVGRAVDVTAFNDESGPQGENKTTTTKPNI
jgi:hypothetical protein